jgi:hypothetical protein
LAYRQGNVDYKYIFRLQPDNVTVSITKINESEAMEKGDSVPRPLTRTVTYARLYADKIVGMPGILRVLYAGMAVNEAQAESKKAEEKPKGKRYQIEATGFRSVARAGEHLPGTVVDDGIRFGVGVTGKAKVTNPDENAYLAVTLPVQYERRMPTTITDSTLTDSSIHTVRAGAGLEGGYRMGIVTPYVGAALTGEVRVTDETVIPFAGPPQVQDNTHIEFNAGALATAGVRVNPTEWWHVGVGMQATVPFSSSGTNISATASTGFSF